MAQKRRRPRTATGVRYWHAGWRGRRVGDILLPVARQQGVFADVQRLAVAEKRKITTDPDLASGRIYDINKVYVTTDRDFAHAWAVCVPDPSLVPMLHAPYGVATVGWILRGSERWAVMVSDVGPAVVVGRCCQDVLCG